MINKAKQTVYYAHSMAMYGTDIEAQDIKMLENNGYKVINPAILELHDMWAYVDIVYSKADMVYYRGYTIGVAQEVISALIFKKQVFKCSNKEKITSNDKENLISLIINNNFLRKDLFNFKTRYPDYYKSYLNELHLKGGF